jgi:hypothetical protein
VNSRSAAATNAKRAATSVIPRTRAAAKANSPLHDLGQSPVGGAYVDGLRLAGEGEVGHGVNQSHLPHGPATRAPLIKEVVIRQIHPFAD